MFKQSLLWISLVLILVSAQFSPGKWEFEIVYDEWGAIETYNIAMDSNDIPYVLFTHGDPDYALTVIESRKIEGEWTIVDHYGDDFGDMYLASGADLIISTDDESRVSYSTWGCDSPGWGDYGYVAIDHVHIYDFDGQQCFNTDIALDNNDAPYVTFDDMYYYDDSITTFDDKYFWDIDIDSSDNPHMLYKNNDNLYHMWLNGSDWVEELVIEDSSEGILKIDSQDNIHILFTHIVDDSCSLYYGFNDGSWSFEEIYPDNCEADLEIDSNNLPHIVYYFSYNYDYGELRYTYKDTSWKTIQVKYYDFPPTMTCSICVDSDDEPHIAFIDDYSVITYYTYWTEYPADFDLLSPEDGSDVSTTPTMDWEDSVDIEDITYDLWYAENTEFDPHYEITELTESTYTFPDGILEAGNTYYWKVKATDGTYETWSGPDDYWSFNVIDSDILLTNFSAVDKGGEAIVLNWSCEATEGEQIEGFNLYRREMGLQEKTPFSGSEDTHPRLDTHLDEGWTQINSSLITGENPYTYIDDTVDSGITYEYKLEAVVEDAPQTLGTTTGMCGLPTSFAITSIHPNPSTDEVKITLSTPETTDVSIEVYDISGRLVKTLNAGEMTEGEHTEVVSTDDLSSGVYTVKATTGVEQSTKRMVVVR